MVRSFGYVSGRSLSIAFYSLIQPCTNQLQVVLNIFKIVLFHCFLQAVLIVVYDNTYTNTRLQNYDSCDPYATFRWFVVSYRTSKMHSGLCNNLDIVMRPLTNFQCQHESLVFYHPANCPVESIPVYYTFFFQASFV